MSVTSYDAVVIGGGPGGATAAALLAERGRRVLVLERESFPRFVVGESLLPLGRDIYRRLGLEDEMERRFIRKYGAHFIKGGEGLEHLFEFVNAMDNPYPWAYHVPRAEHDQMLLDRARALGAEVRERVAVEDLVLEGNRAVGVVARARDGGEPETIRAPFTIDASGRAGVVAKRLRLRRPVPGMNKASAFAHYRGVTRLPGKHEGTPTISTFPGGWFWIIPFRGELTSVGAVMHRSFWLERKGLSPEAILDEAIAASPEVSARLASASRATEVRVEGSFSYTSTRFAGPGWVLCGDAAAFLDPVFSSGVYLSMRCAEDIAARIDRALESGDVSARVFAGYPRRTRAAMRTFWKFIYGFYDEAFFNMFLRPTPRLGLVPAITGVLAGNVHPGFKFRWRLVTMDAIVSIARVAFRLRGEPTVDRARM